MIYSLITALLIFISPIASANTHLPPSLKQYIKQTCKKYHFNQQKLIALFKQVPVNETIIHQINHPYEALAWTRYRKLFLTQQRIQDGVLFWNQHKNVLAQAEKKYGVPPQVIVAILGVETSYGKHKGKYSVLQSLTTLGFYRQSRKAFFQKELTQYLLLTREQKLDPSKLTGSYAGAIGIPQFMPSTYRHYAVDYSNAGSANLVTEPNDAIFSIANYLKKMGWKQQRPVAQKITLNKPLPSKWFSQSAKPRRSLKRLKRQGLKIPHGLDIKTKAALIQMTGENQQAGENWLVFGNFYSIMRYNPRINYAMAVYQLSDEIKNANRKQKVTASSSVTPARKPS